MYQIMVYNEINVKIILNYARVAQIAFQIGLALFLHPFGVADIMPMSIRFGMLSWYTVVAIK